MRRVNFINVNTIYCILLIYMAPTISCQEQLSFETIIELTSKKSVFLLEEPTWIFSKIYNKGEVGPTIYDHADDFMLLNENGKQIQQKLFVVYVNISQMKKGECDNGMVDLVLYFDSLNPGKYTIQMIHTEPPYNPIKSNILSFTVVEPTGDEQIALYLSREAKRLRSKRKMAASAQTYLKLINQYPTSVYAPKSLYKIISSRNLHENIGDDELHLIKRFLLQYSSSEYRGSILLHAKEHFKKLNQIEEAKSFFKIILDESDDQEMKEICSKIIDQIKTTGKVFQDEVN